MKEIIRVTTSSLSPSYAPTYLAEELGYFEDENLAVEANSDAGPGSSWLADNLNAGLADIALGGIWIPLMYKNVIGDFPIFAMVCGRNPQVLMSRTPIDEFTWQHLYDKKILLSMSSTSQWMFLEGLLSEVEVDISRITFIRDLDKLTTMRLWLAGFADFYLVRPPESEELEDKGFFVATTLAEQGGSVPWSVYYSDPEFISRNGELVTRFSSAIQRSFDWIHDHDSLDVARALKDRFPNIEVSILARSIKRLRDIHIWADTIEIPERSFDRYQRMIARYGLIHEPYPFIDVVNVKVVNEVMTSLGKLPRHDHT